MLGFCLGLQNLSFQPNRRSKPFIPAFPLPQKPLISEYKGKKKRKVAKPHKQLLIRSPSQQQKKPIEVTKCVFRSASVDSKSTKNKIEPRIPNGDDKLVSPMESPNINVEYTDINDPALRNDSCFETNLKEQVLGQSKNLRSSTPFADCQVNQENLGTTAITQPKVKKVYVGRKRGRKPKKQKLKELKEAEVENSLIQQKEPENLPEIETRKVILEPLSTSQKTVCSVPEYNPYSEGSLSSFTKNPKNDYETFFNYQNFERLDAYKIREVFDEINRHFLPKIRDPLAAKVLLESGWEIPDCYLPLMYVFHSLEAAISHLLSRRESLTYLNIREQMYRVSNKIVRLRDLRKILSLCPNLYHIAERDENYGQPSCKQPIYSNRLTVFIEPVIFKTVNNSQEFFVWKLRKTIFKLKLCDLISFQYGKWKLNEGIEDPDDLSSYQKFALTCTDLIPLCTLPRHILKYFVKARMVAVAAEMPSTAEPDTEVAVPNDEVQEDYDVYSKASELQDELRKSECATSCNQSSVFRLEDNIPTEVKEGNLNERFLPDFRRRLDQEFTTEDKEGMKDVKTRVRMFLSQKTDSEWLKQEAFQFFSQPDMHFCGIEPSNINTNFGSRKQMIVGSQNTDASSSQASSSNRVLKKRMPIVSDVEEKVREIESKAKEIEAAKEADRVKFIQEKNTTLTAFLMNYLSRNFRKQMPIGEISKIIIEKMMPKVFYSFEEVQDILEQVCKMDPSFGTIIEKTNKMKNNECIDEISEMIIVFGNKFRRMKFESSNNIRDNDMIQEAIAN